MGNTTCYWFVNKNYDAHKLFKKCMSNKNVTDGNLDELERYNLQQYIKIATENEKFLDYIVDEKIYKKMSEAEWWYSGAGNEYKNEFFLDNASENLKKAMADKLIDKKKYNNIYDFTNLMLTGKQLNLITNNFKYKINKSRIKKNYKKGFNEIKSDFSNGNSEILLSLDEENLNNDEEVHIIKIPDDATVMIVNNGYGRTIHKVKTNKIIIEE
jgi:hypothetical protein